MLPVLLTFPILHNGLHTVDINFTVYNFTVYKFTVFKLTIFIERVVTVTEWLKNRDSSKISFMLSELDKCEVRLAKLALNALSFDRRRRSQLMQGAQMENEGSLVRRSFEDRKALASELGG